MEFRRYEKIHRLGKEETDGILEGTVHVQEKVDGANLSVWVGKDGEIRVGSRNNDLTANGNEFNGAVAYCNAHPGIKLLLEKFPKLRLYGEWLVKHTIDYNPTAYKKFYLFDIYDDSAGYFLSTTEVHSLSTAYGIESVPYIGIFESPTYSQLLELAGKSQFGDRGEGVVLKNHNFKNKFGDFCYAKIVTESFKEDNGVTFGGNNKFSDTYWEVYIVNKYIDVARVQKIMNKIQPEIESRLDMKDISRVISTVYHDMITEEAWEIANKVQSIKFYVLKRIAFKKIIQVYKDILNNSLSVADSNRTINDNTNNNTGE